MCNSRLDPCIYRAYSTQVWTAERFWTPVHLHKHISNDDATSGGLCADPIDRPKLWDHFKNFVAYHEHQRSIR